MLNIMNLFLCSFFVFVLSAIPANAQEESISSNNTENSFSVRGQLNPLYHTIISSELSANILELNLREGDKFVAGQQLAVLDCAVYKAQLQKVMAMAESAVKNQEVNQRLDVLDANSVMDLELAVSKTSEMKAQLRAMEVTVNKCVINAPFAGRVVKRFAEPYQYVKPGDPLLEIHNPDELEIILIVPSSWTTWLHTGSKLQFHVEANNIKYPAIVDRIGSQVDPISQTISLSAIILTKHPELLPGMSGAAIFNIPKGNNQ